MLMLLPVVWRLNLVAALMRTSPPNPQLIADELRRAWYLGIVHLPPHDAALFTELQVAVLHDAVDQLAEPFETFLKAHGEYVEDILIARLQGFIVRVLKNGEAK